MKIENIEGKKQKIHNYILEKQGVINFMGPYNQTNSASQDLRNSLDNLMGEERFQTMFKASTR